MLCLTVREYKCVFKDKLPLKIRLKVHIYPEKLRRIQLNTSTCVCVNVCAWAHVCVCALSRDNSEIHLKSYPIDVKGKVRAKPDASAVSKAVTLWKEADQHSR